MTAGRGTIRALLWKEWRQSWQMLVGALIALVALPLGLNALVTLYANALMIPWSWTPGIAALVLIFASPLLAMILAARIFCRDFGADVETFLLAKPVKTSSIVAAKYLAGFGVLAAVIAICAGLELLLAAVTGTLDQFGKDWFDLSRIVCGELPAVVLIFTATAAAGVWLRRTTSAALVGLLVAGLWYALPLMFRGLRGVNVLAAMLDSIFSKGGLRHMLPYVLGTLAAACAAAVLSVRLARWPAQWQVKPKQLAIGAAAAILAMFLGITSQVGNNLKVVESRCSQPGSLLTNAEYQVGVGPVLVGRTVVCATGGATLQFFKWTDDQRLVALWRPDLDEPEPGGTRELPVDIGHGSVRQLVPAGDDRLLVLVDSSTREPTRRGSSRFDRFDQLTLVCVQLSDNDKPQVTGEVLLWQRQRSPEDDERAQVDAELAVSGRYGYLAWRQPGDKRRESETELRVIDLSPQALGEVLATEQLGNFVVPCIRKVDDRLILGGESTLMVEGRTGDGHIYYQQGRNVMTMGSGWPRILEFDISDPSRPRRLAELPRLPRLPKPELSGSLWRTQTAVLFDGQHLFMVDHGSLRVYALASDGKSWELLGRRRSGFLETTLGGSCRPVLRDNDRLYTHSWGFGMLVFDISDPSRPRRIAHWSYIGDWQMGGVLPLGEFIALPDRVRGGRMLVARRP